MIQFLITAAFVLVFVFIFALLASAMLWVIIKLLRSLFPEKFKPGKKREKGRGVTPRPRIFLLVVPVLFLPAVKNTF